MQAVYLVLSPEERAKGFVRPLRDSYTHVGRKPKYPLKPLTAAQETLVNTGLNSSDVDFTVSYEEYPEGARAGVRFWTQAELDGCGVRTTMGSALAETYARDPKFYGGTYCCGCGKHFPVAEFVWDDGEVLGS